MHVYTTHVLTKPKRVKAWVNGDRLLDYVPLIAISRPSLVASGTNCVLVMGV